MLAKLFCYLGLHHPVVTFPGSIESGRRTIALGYCAWCNKAYQWDH